MADWIQLSPGETIVRRSRSTAKDASVLAIMAGIVFSISYLVGEALIGYPFFDIDPLPTWSDFVGSLRRAFVAAVLVFLFNYSEECVVTDHRVVTRHGLLLRVLIKGSEMRLQDIAEIKASRKAKNANFRLISADGGTLTVSFVPDLRELRRALVQQTGLPDPASG